MLQLVDGTVKRVAVDDVRAYCKGVEYTRNGKLYGKLCILKVQERKLVR